MAQAIEITQETLRLNAFECVSADTPSNANVCILCVGAQTHSKAKNAMPEPHLNHWCGSESLPLFMYLFKGANFAKPKSLKSLDIFALFAFVYLIDIPMLLQAWGIYYRYPPPPARLDALVARDPMRPMRPATWAKWGG